MASTPTNSTLDVLVVLDFDGTIAVNDVGNKLVQKFGDFDDVHKRLEDGVISVAEYYRQAADSFTEEATIQSIKAFALEQDVDPGFHDLIDLCDRQGARTLVASDGFDIYIDEILTREDLGRLDVHCNSLVLENGKWTPTFPMSTESCSCYCASCKRNAVLERLDEETILIYVGDGNSDKCAAEHADVIFAKDQLAAHCTAERIPHHPFKTLHDVRRILASKFATSDLKPRRQAVLARRSAIMSE